MGNRKIVPTVSKSDRFRAELAAGNSIADASRTVGIGYAFGYGIAARTIDPKTDRPYSETAANRRAVRSVSVVGGVAEIRPTGYPGVIRVDLETGAVTRTANRGSNPNR